MTPLLLLLSSLAAGLAVATGYSLLAAKIDQFNQAHVADLRDRMQQLAMDTQSLNFYLRLWWLAILGSFLFVGLVLSMWPVAILVALLVYRSARLILNYLADRQRIRIRDQMVLAARTLGNQVRAGVNLEQGLDAVSNEIPDPLGRELQRTMRQFHQGTPFVEALNDLKQRLQLDSIALFVITLQVCLERGGKIGFVLERISHGLEELQRVERKRESDTASGRLLVAVLAVFPAFFLGFFYLLDPRGTALVFSSLLGQVILCLVAGLVYVSVRWAQRILEAVK
jgi:tight adherence protein B